MTCRDLTCN